MAYPRKITNEVLEQIKISKSQGKTTRQIGRELGLSAMSISRALKRTGRSFEIIWIDIDNLAIDTCNIREGKWNYDKELINSIKKYGILYPLIVRSMHNGGKYAILCGSRRYNAAIEAGLTEVPCRIMQLNNFEAIALSMRENRTAGDVSIDKYIKRVKQLNEMLPEKNERERMAMIVGATGLSEDTIKAIQNIGRIKENEAKILSLPIGATVYCRTTELEPKISLGASGKLTKKGKKNVVVNFGDGKSYRIPTEYLADESEGESLKIIGGML